MERRSTYMSRMQAPVGAVKDSLYSVVAGVGSFLPSKLTYVRPELNDPASNEAFDRYKMYSLQVERDSRIANYNAGYFDKVSTSLLIGAFAGVGVGITGALAKLTMFGAAIGTGWGAVIGAGIMVALAVGVGYFGLMARQGGGLALASKEMDVKDFQIRRQAALIAKEIKAQLSKDDERAELKDNMIAAEAVDEMMPKRAAARSDSKSWQQVVAEQDINAERTLY